jgi:hypothetical protein
MLAKKNAPTMTYALSSETYSKYHLCTTKTAKQNLRTTGFPSRIDENKKEVERRNPGDREYIENINTG